VRVRVPPPAPCFRNIHVAFLTPPQSTVKTLERLFRFQTLAILWLFSVTPRDSESGGCGYVSPRESAFVNANLFTARAPDRFKSWAASMNR
jgi:hypothetical protein